MQDVQTIFSTAQTVTGTDTTVLSTDWVDCRVATDLAAGNSIEVEAIVTTAVSGGTSVQMQLGVCELDGSNFVPLDVTPALAIADLGAGTRHILRASPQKLLPAISGSDPRQCLRVRWFTVGAVAAGAWSAHLVSDAGSQRPGKSYPAGY